MKPKRGQSELWAKSKCKTESNPCIIFQEKIGVRERKSKRENEQFPCTCDWVFYVASMIQQEREINWIENKIENSKQQL